MRRWVVRLLTLAPLPHEKELQDEACGKAYQQECHCGNIVQPVVALANIGHVQYIPGSDGDGHNPEQVEDGPAQGKQWYVI